MELSRYLKLGARGAEKAVGAAVSGNCDMLQKLARQAYRSANAAVRINRPAA